MYTKERMLRFRMSRNDECERCGEVESYKHLFWECRESRRVWQVFNEYMRNIGHQHRVDNYENVFNIDKNRIISMIKVKVIQAMIQIERPRGWTMTRVKAIAIELKCLELYNSALKNKKEGALKTWEKVK